MSQRLRKVNELIKHLVANSIEKIGIHGFVTVKAVETTRDMKHAVVWISVLADNEDEVIAEIEGKRQEIQMEINKKIKAKNVPAIHFKLDHSEKHAQKIEELLKDDEENG